MKRIQFAILATTIVMTASIGGGEPAKSETGGGWLLIANKADKTLGVIDPKTGSTAAAVAENGTTGHEVIASPDGKLAYVPIYGDSGVGKPGSDGHNMVVIDLASHKIVGNVDFGKGIRPHCPIFGPKNGMLYVTTELDKTISIIDPKTLKIVGTIPTGQAESHMLAISHDGKRGYTANVGPGTVSVLDMDTRKTLTIIPISSTTQRIAVSMDDKWIFTADQSKPQMAVISAASNKVEHWIPMPAPGYGAGATPDGKWLVVAVPTANKVVVIDIKALKVVQTIDMPKAPQEVLIQPDGKMAYVSCDSSAKVAAIRTSDWKVDKMIDAGKGADGLAWAGSR